MPINNILLDWSRMELAVRLMIINGQDYISLLLYYHSFLANKSPQGGAQQYAKSDINLPFDEATLHEGEQINHYINWEGVSINFNQLIGI